MTLVTPYFNAKEVDVTVNSSALTLQRSGNRPRHPGLSADASTHIGTPANSGHAVTLAPLAALCAIARLHQVAADLTHATRHPGLGAKLTRTRVERLGLTPLPALALMRPTQAIEGDSLRVVILAQKDGKPALLQDPAADAGTGPTIEPVDAFAQHWSGDLILISSRARLIFSGSFRHAVNLNQTQVCNFQNRSLLQKLNTFGTSRSREE